jgi:hypothetical protein
MPRDFEILYKMPTFKLLNGEFKAFTLVVVRLRDNRVVSLLIPLPEYMVKDVDIERELKERKYI